MSTYYFISVLIVLACILLIIVVLLQDSKGGLVSNFSSSNQIMGVRKTTDFLEKATWTFAIALLVLSMLSIFVIPKPKTQKPTTSEVKAIDMQKSNTQPVQDFQAPPKK